MGYPLFEFRLDLWQVDEEMGSLTYFRGLLADMTEIILEFSGRVECLLALIALVTSGIRKAAEGTSADNESISQPEIAILAITLRHLLLGGFLLVVDVEEDLLGNF